ncbi:hypothetical protein [Amycolatopsis viridis]|uniref:TetR family transcriptional regulator n=1 Tax=Amycolatopsis viridis TaxID=185678 RepID=A0ABX0SWZ4_9PSEU|nr:hypothetical protein [Amycolatopsis viridis]NIH81484.1 hypothetical protein [Amycolatopsis viridis]
MEAHRVLVMATAPLYHRLVLMGEPPDPLVVEYAVRDAVSAVTPG